MTQVQAGGPQKNTGGEAELQAGLSKSGVPFIIYKNITFHGMPLAAGMPPSAQSLQEAYSKIVQDISYRFEFRRGVVPHMHCDVAPGDNVMEVGAFLGYYSMFFASRVGPEGRVFSVEFHPGAYQILRRNFVANFPETATAIHRGVLNRSGMQTAYLYRNQANSFREDVILDVCKAAPGEYEKVEVPVDTLANILSDCGSPRLKLLTIQVNGSELEVLEGLGGAEHLVENIFVAAPYGKDGRKDNVAPALAMLEEYGFSVRIENRTGIFAKASRNSGA